MKKHLSPSQGIAYFVKSTFSLQILYMSLQMYSMSIYKKISNPEDVLKAICFQSDMGCVTEPRRIQAGPQTRDYIDWRWQHFCVHSVTMVFSAQLAEGRGLCPTPNSLYLPPPLELLRPLPSKTSEIWLPAWTQIEFISKDQPD